MSNPSNPPSPGQKHAFREQLPNDPSAAGAERRAQGDLLSAHRRAREHEIGDVRIRDEQQAGDRAKQDVERGPDVPHHFIAERLRSGTAFGIGLRILFFQTPPRSSAVPRSPVRAARPFLRGRFPAAQ